MLKPALLLSLLLTSFSALAAPDFMPLVAYVERDGAPLDENVQVEVFIRAESTNGGTLVASVPSLPVVEGLLVIDVVVSDDDLAAAGDAPFFDIEIDGEDMGSLPLGETLYARNALRADSASNADFATAAGSATTADSVAWSNITGVPADFLDGTDADTTYTAGSGMQLTSAVFAIAPAGVTSAHLAPNSVGAGHITIGAVGASEIADNAVGSSEIADNAVGSSEITTNAVGASEIATNAVGASEIADNAVGASEIANNAVGASEIADNAVTASKIASNAVTASKIKNYAVTASKIGSSAVTGSKIATNAVGSSEIADNAVGSSEIADNAVGSSELAASSVRNAHLDLTISKSNSTTSSYHRVSNSSAYSCGNNLIKNFCANTTTKCTGSGRCKCSVEFSNNVWRLCAQGDNFPVGTTADCSMMCF